MLHTKQISDLLYDLFPTLADSITHRTRAGLQPASCPIVTLFRWNMMTQPLCLLSSGTFLLATYTVYDPVLETNTYNGFELSFQHVRGRTWPSILSYGFIKYSSKNWQGNVGLPLKNAPGKTTLKQYYHKKLSVQP